MKEGRKGLREEQEIEGTIRKRNNKMVEQNPNIPIAGLNVKGLNTIIKRPILSEWT